ncbi:DNA-binding transcriptional regulator, LacI/PurR family [Friedmanniella luteola]|uniref:DNA-binding transcriptional regulator, LacI/PurR family n=1 Tax=Friedmanniella luteola TaxID=546871 RepID=A0A1H1LBT4_9ACTN|nr:LacI family DNA-binding transcriptional regulator [Friedmanniella luteola]SDR71772.1 DNA-binding transcriptional regulator, LacI/PurR family [Friedmanniella luteola]
MATVSNGDGGGRPRRPTGADVARRAGLSRATVSYVLNDTPHQAIPEPTRQRVLAAAAELGYTPSAAGRALRNGHSEVVLLLLPDWPIGPSVGELLESLSSALAELGLTFVAHPRSTGRPVSDVWKAITPAAVITFEQLDDAETTKLEAAGVELAVALFGGRRGGRALDIPEQRTGRLQAEHLAAAGHRRLGYAWPDDPRVLTFAQPRLEGVRHACADFGLPEPEVVTVPLTPEGVTGAVRAWRAGEPAVTGICAYNDEVALALLAGARRVGVDVPGDLAVVGVDDIPASAVSLPTLTTVRADTAALAGHIAESIRRKLDGRPVSRRPGSDIHAVIRRESA